MWNSVIITIVTFRMLHSEKRCKNPFKASVLNSSRMVRIKNGFGRRWEIIIIMNRHGQKWTNSWQIDRLNGSYSNMHQTLSCLFRAKYVLPVRRPSSRPNGLFRVNPSFPSLLHMLVPFLLFPLPLKKKQLLSLRASLESAVSAFTCTFAVTTSPEAISKGPCCHPVTTTTVAATTANSPACSRWRQSNRSLAHELPLCTSRSKGVSTTSTTTLLPWQLLTDRNYPSSGRMNWTAKTEAGKEYKAARMWASLLVEEPTIRWSTEQHHRSTILHLENCYSNGPWVPVLNSMARFFLCHRNHTTDNRTSEFAHNPSLVT